MASCKCGKTDDRPGAPPCDCESSDLAHFAKAPHLADFKFCEQCDVECMACKIGACHMNTAPMTNESRTLTGAVAISAVADHNAKGHHHVMWNGFENETVPCGSTRSTELASQAIRDQAIKQRVSRTANQRQVGGNHYGGGEIQHWDLAIMFGWNWPQYQITKYVMRYLDKNGLQDLEKAQHFLEKLIEEIKAGRMAETRAQQKQMQENFR